VPAARFIEALAVAGATHAVVPAIILGALALAIAVCALLYALLRRLGIAEERVGRVGHAWREAGWRAGGTWADFRDWVRTGR
jgi:hypothetical protein